ncbi:MAG: hypothetical protein RIC55_29395 [Pirellulaceae bacterium]
MFVALAMCSAAISQSAETSLHGRWLIDPEKSIADLRDRLTEEQRKILAIKLKSGQLGFEFRERGALVVHLCGEPMEAQVWRPLNERSTKEIVIEIVRSEGEIADIRFEVLAEFIGPDTIRLTHPASGPLMFRRLAAHEEMGEKPKLRKTLPDAYYLEVDEPRTQ